MGEEGASGHGRSWIGQDLRRGRDDDIRRFEHGEGRRWRRGGLKRLLGRTGRGDARNVGRSGRRLTMAGAADWITLAEAQEILASVNVHFTTSTIGAWARSGRLQSIKLGGRRFVRRGEVRALVTAPRRVAADSIQARLFEDLKD